MTKYINKDTLFGCGLKYWIFLLAVKKTVYMMVDLKKNTDKNWPPARLLLPGVYETGVLTVTLENW